MIKGALVLQVSVGLPVLCYASDAMHSMFLPGQPLPDLDDVQDGALYHVLLSDQGIGTVQRHADTWKWRKLTAGNSFRGTRTELEAWLTQEAAHPAR